MNFLEQTNLGRRAAKSCALALSLVFVTTIGLGQASDPVWVQRYNGPVDSSDKAQAMAVDSEGNVIVAGSTDEGITGEDMLVIKYSSAGAVLWANRFNRPDNDGAADDGAVAVAVDSSGNVFVTGYSRDLNASCYITIAYSGGGVALWTNRCNIPGNRNEPKALAVDSSGNVFVTGSSANGSSTNYLTVAYSGAGAQLWVTNYSGPGANDQAIAVTVDNAGKVFVTGYSLGSSNAFDFLTVAYQGADGTPVWERRYDGPASGDDQPTSMRADRAGNVFVTGFETATNRFTNYATIAYSGAGAALWTNHYDGPGNSNDVATSVAVDNSGRVFVTGYSIDRAPNGIVRRFPDYFTIAYASMDGAVLWTNRYNSPENADNNERAIAVTESSGKVFVTGLSQSSGGGRGFDYLTLAYSSLDGTPLWTRRFDGPSNSVNLVADDVPSALAASSGHVFVTGNSVGSGASSDFATIAHSSLDGTLLWTNRYEGRGNGNDRANAVAMDSAGNVFVTGSSATGSSLDYATIAYSSAGVALWTNRYDGPGAGVDAAIAAAVGGGNVFVTGSSVGDGTAFDFATIAYSAAGVPVWTNRYFEPGTGNDQASAIAIDSSNNVFVTGFSRGSGSGDDYATVAYSSGGTALWTNRYNGPGNGNDQATAIAVDNSGRVFVTGFSPGVGSSNDYFTVAYAATNGMLLWTNRYDGPGNADDRATAITVDSSGNVIVTGSSLGSGTSYDYATIAYAPTNGALLWTKRYNGPAINGDDRAESVAANSKGNVFVTGGSVGNGTFRDYATVAYASDGTALWTNRYDGPEHANDLAKAVRVDTLGNVFVTGFSGSFNASNFTTIAYSGSGTQLWVNRYHGPAGRTDFVNNQPLAVSGIGTVVVAGASDSSMGSFIPPLSVLTYDYAVVKYESRFTLGIASQPAGLLTVPGATASFAVVAAGTAPFTYQWRRNGTNLSDAGIVSGATSSNLTLTAVSTNDIGNFSVVISNPAGSITSAVAVLNVVSPNAPRVLLNGIAYAANVVVTTNDAPLTAELQGGFPDAFLIYTTGGTELNFYTGPFQVGPLFSIRALAFLDELSAASAPIQNLALRTAGGGSIAFDAARDLVTGTPVVALIAKPDPGWTFMNWAGDASGTNPTISVTMTRPKSVFAVFGTALDKIASGDGKILTTPIGPLFPFGSVVRLTALPESGNYFRSWLEAVNSTSNPVELTVTSALPTARAVFSVLPANNFALTTSITGDGSVTRSPSADYYTNGAVVTLTPVPGAGQRFATWSGDAASQANPLTVVMNANKSITATFDTNAPASSQPVFYLANPAYAVSEDDSHVIITILKRLNSPGGTVNYATANGSALAPGDYQAVSGSVTFSSDSVSTNITIPIYDNAVYTGERQFSFVLSLADPNSALAYPSNAVVTISDNEPAAGSSLARINPQPAPAGSGALSVLLEPAGVGGQWRLEPDGPWNNSGDVVTGLAPGDFDVSFREVAGFLQPEEATVRIAAMQTNDYIFGYEPVSGVPAIGAVRVVLNPPLLATNVNPLQKGRWRLRSEAVWHDSGDMAINVPVGPSIIEFSNILSYVAPPARQIMVETNQVKEVSAAYSTYGTSGTAPGGRSFADATSTTFDLGFNGQLLTDAGFGSGCVVQPRVVLTAAHVVFDDQTLSHVSRARWYFQRSRGIYEPPPQTARGWYILGGYSAARTNDLPGVSSLDSQKLDTAAVYFNEDAGRGGYSGYLVSEPATEWLTTPVAPGASRTLMGYPVEAPDQVLEPGRIYATPSSGVTVNFSLESDRVFSTTDIHGYPGMSGGPLCVPFTNGVYYPAGVYLGGSGQRTIVRAIDGAVANLIEQAGKSAYTGDNYTGGGVLTLIPNSSVSRQHPGYVRWQLAPPAAVQAGAGWRLQGDTFYSSATNNFRQVTSTNAVVIEFKPIPGWILPDNRSVTVATGDEAFFSAFYTVTNPLLVIQREAGLGITGTTGTVYQLEKKNSLSGTNWMPVSTHTILSPGFNLVLPQPATNAPPSFYRLRWLP